MIKAFSVVHIEEDPNFEKGYMRLNVPVSIDVHSGRRAWPEPGPAFHRVVLGPALCPTVPGRASPRAAPTAQARAHFRAGPAQKARGLHPTRAAC